MRNKFIDAGSTREIDQKMDRILRDLDYKSGAVNLAEVRDLLRLDLSYYTAGDPSFASEVIHKLRIGATQVVKRPGLLLDAIKKLQLKALFLPDRKRILIDSGLPDLKKRWSETHEIAHSVIPWHADYMLGDTKETLSPACHESIEAEANYGAGRLLFPAYQFSEMASSVKGLSDLKQIAQWLGNTITSTLWRFVENSRGVMFGGIGEHPHYPRETEPGIAYLIRSPDFGRQFGNVTEADVFRAIKDYCSRRKSGPLGEGEIVLPDQNGDQHIFVAETFCNRYNALTLARHRGRKNLVLSVAAAGAAIN